MTKAIILTAISLTAISLSACSPTSSNAGAVAYNTSVDVPLKHWTSTDTLFYPIIIDEEPSFQHPLRINHGYTPRLCVRYTLDCPLLSIPADLFVQEMDTVQGQMRIKRRLSHYHIAPAVKDSRSQELGDGWGSLYEYQTTLDGQTISFDRPGQYRFLIIPAFKAVPEGIDGIASIGIELLE